RRARAAGPPPPLARRGEPMKDALVRFTLPQRLEDLSVLVLFVVRAVPGALRRGAGSLCAVCAAIPLGTAVVLVVTGKVRPSMIPGRKDFSDAIKTLRYYLRLSEAQARFDRFDYRQKFEYWGLVMGGLLMVATGFVLYFPLPVTRLLPGVVIPVAKVAH